MRRIALVLGLCALTAVGCAVHEVKPFRSAIIDVDRGISIPVPPPSLTDAPRQDTKVEGEVSGLESAGAKVVTLHLLETVSGETLSVDVEAPVDEFSFDLEMDHSDNCLELWLASDEGESAPVQVHTVIAADDQSVDVVAGCPETDSEGSF